MAKAKTTAKKAPVKKVVAPVAVVLESVRLDPDLGLIPGNSVTFVAREAKGRAAVKISTNRGNWMGTPSNTPSGARQSKILDPGPITVTFYEDGSAYAEGSWTVG